MANKLVGEMLILGATPLTVGAKAAISLGGGLKCLRHFHEKRSKAARHPAKLLTRISVLWILKADNFVLAAMRI